MANRTSHDQNFKNLILDYPLQSLAFFVPAEAPSSHDEINILPVRQEQLKERLSDRYRELDVPLLIEWQDGHREVLLFALEEETEPREFSLHRLAHYCLDLSQLIETNRVVPVVIFLHGADSVARSLTLGSERHGYLDFNYLSCLLPTIPFRQWEHSDNIVARLNLPNMRYTPEEKVRVYGQAIQGLLALEPDLNKQAKYIEFIDIYARLTDNERKRYEQEYPEEVTVMAGFLERAREEGMQQGMEEGMQQGERAVLERQLQRRFGPLAPEVQQRLEQASSEELERWADIVLDANRLEDIFE